MTITTTDTIERYVGDGSQSVWPITFPFFDSEDVKACIVDSSGTQVDLTYGTDYTVTSTTDSIGGSLQYNLADGQELTIWLSLPYIQETDFYNTGPLNAEVLEDAFDRLTLMAQQLQAESDRAVKVSTSSTETPDELLDMLFTGRDLAVASASAASDSEANAALSASAASASASEALASEANAAVSAITAEAWAESDTAPDPNDAESKSAKTWALSASENVPIASTTYSGKIMASASLNVDQTTGEATVPNATEEMMGIVRQSTNDEASAGDEELSTFITPYQLQTYGVPSGFIGMWSGSTETIPTGWALCDGENNTPDLRDRFIVGAGSTYAVDATGGSTTKAISGSVGSTTLATSTTPSHSHKSVSNTTSSTAITSSTYTARATDESAGNYMLTGTSTAPTLGQTTSVGSSGAHTHSFSGTSLTGLLPPYYALAYIMKI